MHAGMQVLTHQDSVHKPLQFFKSLFIRILLRIEITKLEAPGIQLLKAFPAKFESN